MNQLTPATPAELQQILQTRYASQSATGWLPAESEQGFDSSLLDLSGLQQVVDYPYRDMTITVQAGMTIAQLQQVLQAHSQWLPVDVPVPEQMTIAELIVRHWYGSLVAGYGSIRDWLLGIAAVDGTGRLFHSGGRVVKNVAGYDLCKLLVGSEGQLAIPAEVTLQVRPLPEAIGSASFVAEELSQLQPVWEKLRELPLKPVVLDIDNLNQHLTIAVEGTPAAVEQLLAQAAAVVAGLPGIQQGALRTWDMTQTCWSQLELTSAESVSKSHLLRVGVLPSQTLAVLAQAADFRWRACGLSARGTILLAQSADDFSAVAWEKFWHSLQSYNPTWQVLKGNALLQQFAQGWLMQRPAWPLMKKLKAEFDPQQLLGIPFPAHELREVQ